MDLLRRVRTKRRATNSQSRVETASVDLLLLGSQPTRSVARVVRRQFVNINRPVLSKEQRDAVALYEVEFPRPTPGTNDKTPAKLGIDLETDFYGQHAVIKRVQRGSAAFALSKDFVRPGHVVVAVNGRDLSRLSFQEVVAALKTAPPPQVIRFLDPEVLPVSELRHERALVNRDHFGFAKDDEHILHHRRHTRRHQRTNYASEKTWTAFIQRWGGLDAIDADLDRNARLKNELENLALHGIPVMLRPRMWSILARVSAYRAHFPADYYQHMASLSPPGSTIDDIDKDVARTFPEHEFFQTGKGQLELQAVLTAYAVHNPAIGYCQSMNFIVGMLLLFMDVEDAFWLLCAMLHGSYCLPADNYTASMAGIQIDQLVFRALVRKELPFIFPRLEQLGIQIELMTVHWFLCAFIGTLPTSTALRVWDWLFLRGQVVLFVVAVGILRLAQPRILSATTHSELHSIVKSLGTELHDEEEFMSFLQDTVMPTVRSSTGVDDMGPNQTRRSPPREQQVTLDRVQQLRRHFQLYLQDRSFASLQAST